MSTPLEIRFSGEEITVRNIIEKLQEVSEDMATAPLYLDVEYHEDDHDQHLDFSWYENGQSLTIWLLP